ncbi:MAG TPA: hypothetical protein VMR31_18710 [Myxococcota bacterium]|nr:hypothetical protein [Myxococcota bacterium]
MRAPPLALVLLLLLAPVGASADSGWNERTSSHFVLFESLGFARYSGADGSRAFERAVLAALEDAHAQVRDGLRVEPRTKVHVYVYAPDAFDADFASRFGFRAAGFWDGSMHVRGGQAFTPQLVATLHHEYVHAALETAAPRDLWPAWLNEGLAQYFERLSLGVDHLTASEDARLRTAVADGSWIPLVDLSGPSFARLAQAPAELAYLESYAAVEMMFRRAGRERVQNVVREMARTRSLDRALDGGLRTSLGGLEAQLVAELR